MFYFQRAAAAHEVLPLGLHMIMFIPTIQRQGTNEQVDKFAKKAMNYEILGTYAQTELGHGKMAVYNNDNRSALLTCSACFLLIS